MTRPFNPVRYSALVALLAQPDEPGLARRGHRIGPKCDGAEDRRKTVLLPLLIRWAQRRCLSVDPEPVLNPAERSGASPRRRVFSFEQQRQRADLHRRMWGQG